jgi:hypothetical protein
MFLINGELKDPCESILCYEGVTGKTTMTYTWTDQELDAIGATGKTTTTYTWPGRELDAEIDFLYNRVKGPGPKGRHEESAEGDTSKGD